ncbi:MAG TPA: type 4a pilus biogenesis protein PilO [Planctomycetaceae bacterium]|nr:type 4a pilus biogenesis protein PilO [Planctomycetaceae bacterium]
MSLTARLSPLQSYDVCLNGGFAAVTLIASLGVYLGLIHPLQRETAQLTAEAAELRTLIHQTSKITQTRQQLERQLVEKESTTADLLKRMPVSPQESEFLAQVSQLANEAGLEIVDYHPGAVEPLESHHEMEVKISARGDYAAVCRFLNGSSEMPRLCRLIQLAIGSESSGDMLSVDLTFRIYFAPSPAPAVVNKN